MPWADASTPKAACFIAISLEGLTPENHLLRAIRKRVDGGVEGVVEAV